MSPSTCVVLASDHAGFKLKNALATKLRALGVALEDSGPFSYDPSDDYPTFILPAARRVAVLRTQGREAYGVVCGGSGQGEAIAANKVKGVRAAVWYGGSRDIIRLAREHNDAWILSLGARFVQEDEAWEAVQLFLNTPFSGEERHLRRLAALSAWEETHLRPLL